MTPQPGDMYQHQRFHTVRVVLTVADGLVTCQETHPDGFQTIKMPTMRQWRMWVAKSRRVVDGEPASKPQDRREKHWAFEHERMPWPDPRQDFFDRVMARRTMEL